MVRVSVLEYGLPAAGLDSDQKVLLTRTGKSEEEAAPAFKLRLNGNQMSIPLLEVTTTSAAGFHQHTG